MYSVLSRVSALLFCVVFVQCSLASSSKNINVQPIPNWVVQQVVSNAGVIPTEKITNGVFYRLLDNQVKVEEQAELKVYTRFVESIVNETGLDENSQQNISFDPEYQKIILHSLYIIRDGVKLDRAHSAKISILNRETELKNQIYNGELTLNILLNDLRVGDTLDYSYSRIGENPVYKNIFSFARGLSWSVPVYQQHLRVLWGKSKPLYVTTRNIEPVISEQQIDGFTEYTLKIVNPTVVDKPSETPGWYDPYGVVYFSETQTWKDVIDWARPLYQLNGLADPVKELAAKILQEYKLPEQQIVAALKFTQDKIRYVGLEMGQNSHLPTAPEQTMDLGYGDCKDKALLFIAILKAMNIEATPALVNTEDTKLVKELPPRVAAFDHVIVMLKHNGERIWLDPTLSNQKGDLTHIYQPNYAYALVLGAGEGGLTPMETEQSKILVDITETYLIPQYTPQEVKFSVSSRYQGNEAIRKQKQFLKDGLKNISKDYEIYYQRTHSGLSSEGELKTYTDDTTGMFSTSETYTIDKFWTEDEHFEAEFYPHDIRSAVFKPSQINRDAPLKFGFPNNIRFQLKLEFDNDNWEFDNVEFVEDNDFFMFTSSEVFADNTLTVTFNYSAKTDHIAYDKIEDYLAARERLRDEAYMSIVKYRINQQDEAAAAETAIEDTISSSEDNWLWGIGGFYALAILFIIVSWRMESTRRPEFDAMYFYPMTQAKFLVLNFGTLGLYLHYWCYRNWKAIKTKENSDIMPIARGIFAIFWYYPLFDKLKGDSIARYGANKVLPIGVAVVFAIGFLILPYSLHLNDTAIGTLMTLLPILLLIPFVNYIDKACASEDGAKDYNSKWRIRQILAFILFLPILPLAVLGGSGLFPSDEVVTQSDIFERDLKFLYRQDVFSPNEEIVYFYSDAVLSVRDDGNGFTEQTVFSYWSDDKDSFNLETASFQDIKKIDVKFDEEYEGTTIVTITRQDDSDFLLFVSNINDGDELFVKKLKQLWEALSA
ncbi:MAG: transglutaminase-like putative cysteine protease [Granulosicoccus sp.]